MSPEQHKYYNAEPINKQENGSEINRSAENITDLQMGSLLAAVGNHEAKALTLIAMSDGQIYTETPLATAVINLQADLPAWNIGRGTTIAYCAVDFADADLVDKVSLGSPGPAASAYVISEKGKRYGLPLAGLLLDFSFKNPDLSLAQIFGNTTSPRGGEEYDPTQEKKYIRRSPLFRYQILQYLATSGVTTIREIAQDLGIEDSVVGNHIRLLAGSGIINFQSKSKPTRYSLLKTAKPTPQKSATGLSMSHALISAAAEFPADFTLDQAVSVVAEMKGDLDDMVFKRSVRNALDRLVRQGFIKKSRPHRTDKTRIYLSVDQHERLSNILSILQSFQKNDPIFLQRGYEAVEELLQSPDKCSQLMLKARKASYAKSDYNPQSRKTILVELLKDLQDPKDVNELHAMLQQRTGETIRKNTVRKYLNELATYGVLIRSVVKGRNHWILKGDN